MEEGLRERQALRWKVGCSTKEEEEEV